MIFETLNSKYEVSIENKQIRRLNGKNTPTKNQGQDGEWKKYVELRPIEPMLYHSLLIVWDEDHTTLTSPVTEVSK